MFKEKLNKSNRLEGGTQIRRERNRSLQCRRRVAAAWLRGPPSFPPAEDPETALRTRRKRDFSTRETSSKLKREFCPHGRRRSEPRSPFASSRHRVRAGIPTPARGPRGEPSAQVSSASGPGPGPARVRRSPWGGGGAGASPASGQTAKLPPPAPPLPDRARRPRRKVQRRRRAAEGERGRGAMKGFGRAGREEPAPATPARRLGRRNKRPPDPAASLPTVGGGRGGCAPRAALPVRKGLSGPVSPKFMVGLPSRVPEGGIVRDQGKASQTREEKTPNSDWAAFASLTPAVLAKSGADGGIRSVRGRRLRAPGAGSVHTSERGRARRAAAAAGGSAPGPRSPAAFGSLLRRAGPGGTAETRATSGAGGRGGEERPEPRPRRAELRARRRRRRQDKGDHVRREGGGRGRRRRRAHRGGGGGGFSQAAASGSPTAGPPLQQRHGPPGPGPAAAAAAAPEGDAPGVFIFGQFQRRGAPSRLRGTDGASWLELAGGGERLGWLGSGPRSARGRLPLPPAHGSSELHRRPSPAPRAPWLNECREGAAAAPGPQAPDLAPRLRRARLRQTLAALGAGLPRRAEPEQPVPPPLLRSAPRAPPLVAPPLGLAPGLPGRGAVPGRDKDSCRSPRPRP